MNYPKIFTESFSQTKYYQDLLTPRQQPVNRALSNSERKRINTDTSETTLPILIKQKPSDDTPSQSQRQKIEKDNINNNRSPKQKLIKKNQLVVVETDQGYDSRLKMLDKIIEYFEESDNSSLDPYQYNLVMKRSIDIKKVLLVLRDIGQILANVSDLEINLNKTERSYSRLSFEYGNFKTIFEKQKQTLVQQSRELDDLKLKFRSSQNENYQLNNQLLFEGAKKDDLSKKVRNLEDRLEFAASKNLNAHKDSLSNTLGNLIKENEQLKRQRITLQKEIERQKTLIAQLNSINSTLQKKLESLKTKRNYNDEKDDEIILELQRQEQLLNAHQIPQNLDFRKWALQQDHQHIITDLTEHGPEAFAFQIVNLEDKNQRRELSSFISSQFISQVDFSERVNILLQKMEGLFKQTTIKEIMEYINKEFKSIFHSDQQLLWLMEEQTGYLFTYDLDGYKHKILIEKGIFKESFKSGKIQNSNLIRFYFKLIEIGDDKVLLYQSLEKNGTDVFGNKLVLIPLINAGKKTCGVFEISRIYEDKYITDEQYLGIIVAKYTKQIIQKVLDYEQLQRALKYRDIAFDKFALLCNQSKKNRFVECIYEFAQSMFCTSRCLFLFVNQEEKTFIKYNVDGTYEECDGNIGVSGYVSSTQKTFISPNITKDVNFHNRTDLDTLCPVYIKPILSRIDSQNRYHTLAILQFVIKRRRKFNQGAMMDYEFSLGNPNSLKQDSVESDAQLFAQLVSSAYMLCEGQLQD